MQIFAQNVYHQIKLNTAVQSLSYSNEIVLQNNSNVKKQQN